MNTVVALESLAIKAAQENRWDDAIKINEDILNLAEDDISALNRLGYCFLQKRSVIKAKRAYERVLSIDKYNNIAKKYLDVIGLIKKRPITLPNGIFHETFIDEPGKTKTVHLCRVADTGVLSTTAIGTPCELIIKNHRIAVETEGDGKYLGSLPDDLSHHLTRLLKHGNKYKTVVKSVNRNSCAVFIKELSRSKRLAYTTSFPNSSHPGHIEAGEELLIVQAPLDMAETGEEETEPAATEDREE